MNQVWDFFKNLFSTADWPPRWHCGNWTEFHGWLYIISDLLIWSAYFAIPITILRYITRRTEVKFVKTYFLFAAFILACGSTHLLDAVIFWFPAYRLSALVRFITGVISWATVFHLVKLLPVASQLRSHAELEKEIEEREKAEEALRLTNNQLIEAQEIAKMGSWQWNIAQGKIEWSDGMYKLYGKPKDVQLQFDEIMGMVHPEDREALDKHIENALATHVYSTYTYRICRPDGIRIMMANGDVVLDDQGKVVQMIGTIQDITEQQLAQQQILEKTKELELLNEDLQRFAYVASHDLQEPLRKILTFSSLLEKESENKDEKSKMYLEKITQASSRMQKLIQDILQFSSIKSTPSAFEKTDLNKVISQVLADVEVQIEKSKANIQVQELPVIEAIPSQMGQLFQNLVSNSLKFSKPDGQPQISITSKVLTGNQLKQIMDVKELSSLTTSHAWERENFVKIVHTDKGIGFDEQYAEKVFEIFQRLHGKMYTGTGIGLAICKKVVDTHHGFIAAQSRQGEGASFTIILPVSQKGYLV